MKTVMQASGLLVFAMSEDEFRELAEEMCGLCRACGEVADGVEPDACKYECEACERPQVYGMEELLVMGLVAFTEEVGE